MVNEAEDKDLGMFSYMLVPSEGENCSAGVSLTQEPISRLIHLQLPLISLLGLENHFESI